MTGSITNVNNGIHPIQAADEGMAVDAAALQHEAPAAAQTEAPAAGAPDSAQEQLQAARGRLEDMARKAVERSQGLPCLDEKTADRLKAASPRPWFNSERKEAHAALEAAADRCDEATRVLAQFKAADFAGANPGEDAMDALAGYVEAQNGFAAAVDAFVAKGGRCRAGLASLRQASQNRIGEMLNFAAQMRTMTPEDAAGVDMMREVGRSAVTMHGGHEVLGKTAAEAQRLFDRLDAIQGMKNRMPLSEFHKQIDVLAGDAKALKKKLEEVRVKAAVIADAGAFEAVAKLIDRSVDRVAELKRVDERGTVLKAFRQALPWFDMEKVVQLADLIPTRDGQRLCMAFEKYNAIVERTEQAVRSGSGINEIPRSMTEALRQFGRSKELITALDEYQYRMERNQGNQEMTDFCALVESVMAADEKRIGAEGRQIVEMLAGIGRGMHARGEYIAAAFKYNLNLPMAVEASLRGLPVDQLELTASDDVLVEARRLGHGAVNAVELCEYRGADGESVKLVFKPELGARRGLDNMMASGFGYGDAVTSMQLNVASCIAADEIGCGGVIARSRIGSRNGTLGLFMEAAPGKTAAAMLKGNDPVMKNAEDRELSVREGIEYMRDKGTLDAVRANLMNECSKLEWADLLSGQSDRHQDNYLVSINPDTGAVKVTGIDNDASFGVRRVGLNKINVTGSEHVEMLKRFKVTVDADGTIDIGKLNNMQRSFIYGNFGLNQMSTPSVIGRNVFERLRNVDEEAYAKKLAACMDAPAVESAVSRLRAAKAHAAALDRQGRVIDDWADGRAAEALRADYKEWNTLTGMTGLMERVTNGFYNRDLKALFG